MKRSNPDLPAPLPPTDTSSGIPPPQKKGIDPHVHIQRGSCGKGGIRSCSGRRYKLGNYKEEKRGSDGGRKTGERPMPRGWLVLKMRDGQVEEGPREDIRGSGASRSSVTVVGLYVMGLLLVTRHAVICL